eukprot:TRINITY_DN21199_c0_g1_i1.p1 TRINITY_DN21199_c0_g1~~TRINITY_DN21199_c0_g1_i1.p1  ORF type:complete len:348 (+),score=79.52 TRINITY_DN21199_c0_g1_i1:177-1220(+)
MAWYPSEQLESYLASGPSSLGVPDSLAIDTDSQLNVDRARRHAKLYDRDADELVDLALRFKAAGGKVIFAPTAEEIEQRQDSFCMHITQDMHLIPVCHQGLNRSQVLHFVLLAAAARMGAAASELVSAPHGATSGCDPFCAHHHLSESNFVEWLHDPGHLFRVSYDIEGDTDPQQGPLHRAFLAAFGSRKVPRVGEDAAYRLHHLNDATELTKMELERTQLRRFMSDTLFQPDLPPLLRHRRRLFVAFMRAAPIVMERLLEVQAQQPQWIPLNATVVALPYYDDLNTALRNAQQEAARASLSVHEWLRQAHVSFFARLASLFYVVTPTPRVADGEAQSDPTEPLATS